MKIDKTLNVLMVASEDDGLLRGKVGGIGDVVRDVPPALSELSCRVAVVVPSYGFLHLNSGAELMRSVEFRFSHIKQRAELYAVPGKVRYPNVTHTVLHHPDFESFDIANGVHRIYVNDPPDRPFMSDATKYALFCMAVAEAMKEGAFGPVDVLHLHDWHASFLLILREFHEQYAGLKDYRTVYTIHNLAYQGIRPFRGSYSSLEEWYPAMRYDPARLIDPIYRDCVNPMAAGIRLADAVHTVSPSYAEEILQPSDKKNRGYYGGEGLEEDLRAVYKDGRLFGILNGCDYPPDRAVPKVDFPELLELLRTNVLTWAGSQQALSSSHFIAHTRLAEWIASPDRPGILLTSVSRVNDQKMRLMIEPSDQYPSGLQGILDALKGEGIYIMLGSGDPDYEKFLTKMSSRYRHFIFLNGYSDECAKVLYANGDLFLMPSSYEPCGISQMLAMRDGQPCLVHNVGGLKDTVKDGVNGFSFDGDTIADQVADMVHKVEKAIEIHRSSETQWRQIRQRASEARFLWKDSVARYIEKLYSANSDRPA